MTKLNRDTPEWNQEWAKLAQITEALRHAPADVGLQEALKQSAEKVGVIVPITATGPVKPC
jgi:hypothetical protein